MASLLVRCSRTKIEPSGTFKTDKALFREVWRSTKAQTLNQTPHEINVNQIALRPAAGAGDSLHLHTQPQPGSHVGFSTNEEIRIPSSPEVSHTPIGISRPDPMGRPHSPWASSRLAARDDNQPFPPLKTTLRQQHPSHGAKPRPSALGVLLIGQLAQAHTACQKPPLENGRQRTRIQTHPLATTATNRERPLMA